MLDILYYARGYVIKDKDERNILSSNFSGYFRPDWEMAYKDVGKFQSSHKYRVGQNNVQYRKKTLVIFKNL